MRHVRRDQSGMSLVEATIILLVLMMLTGVLAPSIFDFVIDAKLVLVKEDCEAIGVSVARLVRDVGPCLMKHSALGCTKDNRIDIMYSPGSAPVGLDAVYAADVSLHNMNTQNWIDHFDQNGAPSAHGAKPSNLDTLYSQLVANGPNYPPVGHDKWHFTMPKFMLGWRGPYLTPPIEPDPWGHAFQVNTGFLSVATIPAHSPDFSEGGSHGGWNRPVFCMSPGPNGIVETSYGSFPGGGLWQAPWADDILYIIAGATR